MFFVIYVFYNVNVLNNYSSSFFEVDFDKKWNNLINDKDKLLLKNDNDSVIQIIGRVNEYGDIEQIEDIYFNLEEEFHNNNNKYNLINISNSNVGRNYNEAKEYLYEYNGYQILLIVIVKKQSIIEITYTAKDQFFDFDLSNFYQIVNSLKISGEKV